MSKRYHKHKKLKSPRKKIKKQKKVTHTNENQISPMFYEFESPFENFSSAEVKKILDGIGTSNQKNLKKSLLDLDSILKEYNPIQIISIVANYGLSIGVGNDGVYTEQKRIGIEQAYVELLQAIILHLDLKEIGIKPPGSDIIQTVIELLQDINFSFSFSRMKGELKEKNETERTINLVQEYMRGHTQVVRNWGSHLQIVNLSKELYSYFDKNLLNKVGYSTSNIIEVFEFLLRDLERKVTQRFKKIRKLFSVKDKEKLIKAYYKLLDIGDENPEEFINKFDINRISKKNIQAFILSHYDLFLPDIFFLDPVDISSKTKIEIKQIENILEYFSFTIGELKNKNEYQFFLDNPIWLKPIIKIDSNYFCPMPQLFFSFILQIMDNIVVEHLSKESLKKRRSKFLEIKIEEIVKRRFPSSLTRSGVKWNYEGKIYETDLITFIDSYAIIIEAKSHKISNQALRGAPLRMKKHINEIIIEPAIQSFRLMQKLYKLIEQPNSEDELHKNLPVDIKNIHKIVRLSVSLENFGNIQSSLKTIESTGWLPNDFHPCPTMNLADFETLFDYLEHPVQIIHYLIRRQKLETEINIQGTELDFMGFYKDTLFNLGNLTESDPGVISIFGMSKDIDHYYDSLDSGIKVKKPLPKISPMFLQIFNHLEGRNTKRWTEIGTMLVSFPPDLQSDLENKVNQHKKIVQKSWKYKGHKNTIFAKPFNSDYVLAIVLYKNNNAEKKYEFIENASILSFEDEQTKKCIVITKNIDHPEQAYSFIGLYEK